MQQAIGKVWKRFTYASVVTIWNEIKAVQASKNYATEPEDPRLWSMYQQESVHDSHPGGSHGPEFPVAGTHGNPTGAMPRPHGTVSLDLPRDDGSLEEPYPPDTRDTVGTGSHTPKVEAGALIVTHQASDESGRTRTRIVGRVRARTVGKGREEEEEDEEEDDDDGEVMEEGVPGANQGSVTQAQSGEPMISEEDLIDWMDGLGNNPPKAVDGKTSKKLGKTRKSRKSSDLLLGSTGSEAAGSSRRGNRWQKRSRGGEHGRHSDLPDSATGLQFGATNDLSEDMLNGPQVEGGLVHGMGSGHGRTMKDAAFTGEEGYRKRAEGVVTNVGEFQKSLVNGGGGQEQSQQGWVSRDHSGPTRSLSNFKFYSEHMQQEPASLPGTYRGDLRMDDAMATILAWLYDRIPETRAPKK